MRILIDTQVWICMQDSPERLPRATLDLIMSAENGRFLSIASCWEMAIKTGNGKLRLPLPLPEFVSARLASSATTLLPISVAHALRVAELPSHHRDPFDRLLIAQALAEKLAVATADRMFQTYGVEVLPA